MKNKFIDVLFMTRDFVYYIGGKDYFRKTPCIGCYFEDDRGYFYDFRAKVTWPGNYENGVPKLSVPSWLEEIFFPITILQYGLGSLDCYFVDNDASCAKNIHNVTQWLLDNHSSNGSFENYFPKISPQHKYFSSNSALTQGHVLSFLSRVCAYRLVTDDMVDQSMLLLDQSFRNMIQPLNQGGTALFRGKDLIFCEVCREDDYVVFNGWAFAIFGLWDFNRFFPTKENTAILKKSLQSFENSVDSYALASGWSIYDSENRICSPVYNDVHIVLIEALRRLKKSEKLTEFSIRLAEAQTKTNQLKYTFLKVVEKLKDKNAYLTR